MAFCETSPPLPPAPHGAVAGPPSIARPQAPLAGSLGVPGDKSISHRALMLGALAVGETEIDGLLEGEDVLRTAAAMRALGARRRRAAATASGGSRGRGIGGAAEPADVLDCGNAGTGARLIMGAGRRPSDHRHLHRRRLLRGGRWRRVPSRCARWARASSRARAAACRWPSRRGDPVPDRLPPAGALGPGEVGGAAGRPQHAAASPR